MNSLIVALTAFPIEGDFFERIHILHSHIDIEFSDYDFISLQTAIVIGIVVGASVSVVCFNHLFLFDVFDLASDIHGEAFLTDERVELARVQTG